MMEQRKLTELREEYEKPAMSHQQLADMRNSIEKGKVENMKANKKRIRIAVKCAAAAAVVLFVAVPNTSAKAAYAMSELPVIGKLVQVITFRDYQYEGERNHADVEVPELVVTAPENREEVKETEAPLAESGAQEKLEKTTEEINQEIQQITEQIIQEFETHVKEEMGYQDVLVKHEILSTTKQYFTLKLICYQGAGSGAEWDYFYTIDLKSGERIALRDLFKEGADYLGVISQEIKRQMREQMQADEAIMYWVDYTEVEEWNFQQITEDTSFYVNQENNVVIAFNEGDVAPMYMGCVEFVIPEEVLKEIRK